MAQDLSSVVEDIITAYEVRVRELSNKLSERGALLLDRFREERANLTQTLESGLAKNTHLRKKDFRLMMQDVESYQMERENKVRQLIETLSKDESERIQGLKNSLHQGGVSEAIKRMTSPGKEKLVETELAEFEKEKDELYLQLKQLLEKADCLRIKDFKKALKKLKTKKEEAESNELVKNITSKQQELEKEVSELLINFKAFQHSIERLWQKEVMRDGDG